MGAIGTGKTTACIYPYVEQLPSYRASDAARKVGGLILDVKGDFSRHVRTILERHGRAEDYVEVGLESPYRYNPLHNELDAYALAFGIATLMTNLYGRGKEPFWQQAPVRKAAAEPRPRPVWDQVAARVQVLLTESAQWTGEKQRLTATRLHALLLAVRLNRL